MTGTKLRQRRRHRPSIHTPGGVVTLRESTVLIDIPPVPQASDAVLARAREQWQQGDWQGLAQTPLASIEHHPQRARLALLLAAGHQQLGHVDAARQCATQALEWGCERRAVAQVLISGIHGSLARAAAIDEDAARSRRHLEAALSMAYPGQDVQALLAQRLLSQAEWQAPLPGAGHAESAVPRASPSPHPKAQPPSVAAGDTATAPAATTAESAHGAMPLAPSPAESLTPLQRIPKLLCKLQQEVAALRTHLDTSLQQRAAQQSQLLEAYLRIGRSLDGMPDLPSFQNLAISADLGAHLLDRVAQGGFDAIIEFGSGSSTLLVALACARLRKAATEARHATPLHLALEHLHEHQARTQALLARHLPGHGVRLVLAPLVPWGGTAGQAATPYYDCDDAMRAVAAALASLPHAPRLLVLVDGPPASTGTQARYPALAALLRHFGQAEVECIVDDYGRPDDHAVVERWLAELRGEARNPKLADLPFVKSACRLTWTAPAAPAIDPSR